MMFAAVLYLGAIEPLDEATRGVFRWLGFLIATPVVFYSAQPFFAGAARSSPRGGWAWTFPWPSRSRRSTRRA